MARRTIIEAIIPSSGTDSAAKTIPDGRRVVGLHMPAAFDGTALTFKAAYSTSATPVALYNGGTQYTVNCGVNRFIALDPNVMLGVVSFIIVSGSSESAARTIQVVTSD